MPQHVTLKLHVEVLLALSRVRRHTVKVSYAHLEVLQHLSLRILHQLLVRLHIVVLMLVSEELLHLFDLEGRHGALFNHGERTRQPRRVEMLVPYNIVVLYLGRQKHHRRLVFRLLAQLNINTVPKCLLPSRLR